jgi:hypothetical protein
MNDDPQSPRERGERPSRFDRRRGWPPAWSETTRLGRRTITRVYSYVDPEPDSIWVIEHDPEKGIFHLTGPDGTTAKFRDQPTRYLAAEPHYQTGEMMPVIIQGSDCRPRYLYLCPEEREDR